MDCICLSKPIPVANSLEIHSLGKTASVDTRHLGPGMPLAGEFNPYRPRVSAPQAGSPSRRETPGPDRQLFLIIGSLPVMSKLRTVFFPISETTDSGTRVSSVAVSSSGTEEVSSVGLLILFDMAISSCWYQTNIRAFEPRLPLMTRTRTTYTLSGLFATLSDRSVQLRSEGAAGTMR